MNVIYEDEFCIAEMSSSPAVMGHVVLSPKGSYKIAEEVPDELIGHLFNTANMLSSILFETLGIQGTNIIIQNGVSAGQKKDGVVLHIIPRKEGDGLDFRWSPTSQSKDVAEIKLKECTERIVFSKKAPEAKEIVEEVKTTKSTKWIEDALLRLP